jgi:hypothetical protein
VDGEAVSIQSQIRGVVKTCNHVFASVQGPVTITPWTGQDAFGSASFGAPFTLTALVEQGEKSYDMANGVTVTTKATVTFLQPVPVNGAAGRVEPIDDRDVIRLADGTTGPVVMGLPMLVDPSTTKPYFQQIGIGK